MGDCQPTSFGIPGLAMVQYLNDFRCQNVSCWQTIHASEFITLGIWNLYSLYHLLKTVSLKSASHFVFPFLGSVLDLEAIVIPQEILPSVYLCLAIYIIYNTFCLASWPCLYYYAHGYLPIISWWFSLLTIDVDSSSFFMRTWSRSCGFMRRWIEFKYLVFSSKYSWSELY